MSYSNSSWEQLRKLRERMRNGEELNIANGRLGMSKTDIEGILGGDSYDMIGVDSQHAPFNEEKLVEFCRNARELDMPVQFRIKNTRHTYLLGNLLDLGPAAIVVPQVETEATVDEAISSFYYPPVGKRSWPPPNGWGWSGGVDWTEYIEWWNENGILSFQIESVEAVLNARKLAKPGISMIHWGKNDLNFSLELYPDPPFASFEECVAHVQKQMEGTGVKVANAIAPSGRL